MGGDPRAKRDPPASDAALAASPTALARARIGVPRMCINADPDAGCGDARGGPFGERIITRRSIIDLWSAARRDLEAAGAAVVEVDFPAVSNCEGDRPGAPTIGHRGLVPPEFLRHELLDLIAWALDDFLAANGDPALQRLVDVDGFQNNPHDPDALPPPSVHLLAGYQDPPMEEYARIATRGITAWNELPGLEAGLRGLEETRRIDLEQWMDRHGLTAVAFPAVADVAPADADVNPASAKLAWRNGVWVANGNLAIRHLGIPTVTVPMGTMHDTGMPVVPDSRRTSPR